LDVVLSDGTRLEMLLKDLRMSEVGATGLSPKPTFLHNPRREIEAYRLLASAGLGVPICHAAGDDWVLLEKVPGVELWQLGNVDSWVEAARWLERLHALFAERPPESEHFLRYDAAYFRIWPDRARRRHPELSSVLGDYEHVVELLSGLPTTLIHGEFYASNVLVSGSRIAPVDWEMAGVGPGVLDLAALSTGWADDERTAILGSYGHVPVDALDAARLHLGLQWLGWSPNWTPPPEHAHDWLNEVTQASKRLGL
jgi:aminoglycoside phosphotransferase